MLIARHISHKSNGISRHDGKCISLCALAALFMISLLMPAIGHTKLSSMSATEMKEATGQAGLTQFNMSNNTARLFLDIHIETLATMDNFSIGGNETSGWHNNWNNVTLGKYDNAPPGAFAAPASGTPLVIDGMVFMADFDDASNLERVVLGSNRLQGNISATMNTFSGGYNPLLTTGVEGSIITDFNGDAVNPTAFNFDSDTNGNMGLFFVLTRDKSTGNMGVQVVAGYNETNLTTGVWWDKP